MKETQIGNYSQAKFISSVIVISVFVSVISSFVVVNTLVPIPPTVTSIPTILPTVQPSPTVYVLPSVTTNATPFQLQIIETNLLQNGEFENGLTEWMYTNNEAGITVFETTGMNGKGYCSRRLLDGGQLEFLSKEWVGFAQDVPIDPTESYSFSAWVKLYQAAHVITYVKYYYDSREVYSMLLNTGKHEQTEGSTGGWFLIQKFIGKVLLPGLPTANHVVIGFWHAPIQRDTIEGMIDSTFCIDNIVFGKIVK